MSISRNKFIYALFFLWMTADFLGIYLDGAAPVIRFLILAVFVTVLLKANGSNLYLLYFTALVGFVFYYTSYASGHSDYPLRASILIILTSIIYNNIVNYDCKKLYALLTVINYMIFLSIISGIVLGLNVYDNSDGRFGGSKGLNESTNQLSYLVILVFSSNLIYIQNLKSNFRCVGFLPWVHAALPFICALLITTKASIIGVLLLSVAYLLANSRWLLVMTMIGSVLFLVAFRDEFLLFIRNISSLARILDNFDNSYNLLDLITSGRWLRLVENFDSISNLESVFPFRVEHINFESDVFDVWYYSGLVGVLLFGYTLFKVIACLRVDDAIVLATIITIILSSLLAGHFLTAIISAPALAVFGVFAKKNMSNYNQLTHFG